MNCQLPRANNNTHQVLISKTCAAILNLQYVELPLPELNLSAKRTRAEPQSEMSLASLAEAMVEFWELHLRTAVGQLVSVSWQSPCHLVFELQSWQLESLLIWLDLVSAHHANATILCQHYIAP